MWQSPSAPKALLGEVATARALSRWARRCCPWRKATDSGRLTRGKKESRLSSTLNFN